MLCWQVCFAFADGVAVFGMGLGIVLFFMHLVSIIYTKFYLNQRPPELMKAQMEGVSLLKPLKGVDSNLEENLETFFQMDYPQFEMLFCIQDKEDPAMEVCRRLIRKYPNVDARIVAGGEGIGANPKINNITPAYKTMKYNYFWICDSGIKVRPLTLRDLVSKMTDKVALVHAPPYVTNRKGLSSAVEKIYFGTQHARAYICANLLGIICTSGTSMLLRKDYFEQSTGGMENVSQYMAEDYFIAKFLSDSGFKTTISSYPSLQNSGNYGLGNFVQRSVRWMKMRLFMVPLVVIVEPLSECFLAGLLFSWSCLHFFGWNMLAVFLFHVMLWCMFDYMLCKQFENGPMPISRSDFLAAWLIRESLTPLILVMATYDPTISWRTRRFRPRCGGKAEEMVHIV